MPRRSRSSIDGGHARAGPSASISQSPCGTSSPFQYSYLPSETSSKARYSATVYRRFRSGIGRSLAPSYHLARQLPFDVGHGLRQQDGRERATSGRPGRTSDAARPGVDGDNPVGDDAVRHGARGPLRVRHVNQTRSSMVAWYGGPRWSSITSAQAAMNAVWNGWSRCWDSTYGSTPGNSTALRIGRRCRVTGPRRIHSNRSGRACHRWPPMVGHDPSGRRESRPTRGRFRATSRYNCVSPMLTGSVRRPSRSASAVDAGRGKWEIAR